MLFAFTLSAQNNEAVSQAEAYLQEGDYAQVIAHCTASLKTNPELYYCYGLRGIAYYHKTNAARAYEDLTIALSHFPTEQFFYYRSRARNRTNYKGIFDDLSEAIAINPNNPRYFYNRGKVRWKAFSALTEKYTSYNLVLIEKELGFAPDPCADFEQATALDAGYAKTLKTCEKFQGLLK